MSDIFIAGHLTDFEKLLFAEAHIKEMKKLYDEAIKENSRLHIEIGKVKSLVQEFEHASRGTKDERKTLRAISYNKALLEENKNLRARNKKLMRDNAELINKLITAKNEKN